MSFFGSIAKIGSLLLPGAAGAVAGAVGGMIDGGGSNGSASFDEARRLRERALEVIGKGVTNWDQTVRGMDFSPETAIANLDKSTAFYNDISQKNAVTNSHISRMLRSTEPGTQLANQNAEMRLAYADQKQKLIDEANQRRLAVQQQSLDNESRMANVLLGQVPELMKQGNYEQAGYDANTMAGMQGVQRIMSDPGVSEWVSGRLKIQQKPGKAKGFMGKPSIIPPTISFPKLGVA
jgi:hypothetical protein